jgi:hypothetical protein
VSPRSPRGADRSSAARTRGLSRVRHHRPRVLRRETDDKSRTNGFGRPRPASTHRP